MLYLQYSKTNLECGTDEAGRGCLAGPVTAAAVILPQDFELHLLNDSKQLSEKTREQLKPIIEAQAICFAVTHIDAATIDETNILNASIKAMQASILKLNPLPIYIIVDGNSALQPNHNEKSIAIKRFSPLNTNTFHDIPFTAIIKGDSKYLNIAAASVLAIGVLHVTPARRLHQARRRIIFCRGEQQMHVVGHQRIGVDGTAAIARRLFEPMEVALIVLLGEEAGLAVDAALDDV